MTDLGLTLNILGYAALVVGAALTLRSKVKTDNLADLKERVSILEKEREYSVQQDLENKKAIKSLEEELQFARREHIENQKAIAGLEGQLKTYKEIPLKSIANSLESLPKIVESNSQILNTLKGSALIAAKDRDTLLNPNQHIDEQVVENQVIKKTEVK